MRQILIATVLLFSSLPALATEYVFVGQIEKIISLDSRSYGPDTSHILVQGFTSAGSCPTNDGLVALVLRDDEQGARQLQTAIAAMTSGRLVAVRVNDSFQRAGGMCYLKYLELRRAG